MSQNGLIGMEVGEITNNRDPLGGLDGKES